MLALRFATRAPARRALFAQPAHSRSFAKKSKPAAPSATPKPEPTPATEVAVPAAGLPTLDFSPSDEPKSGGRTGAKSSKDSLSSVEQRRQLLGRVSFGLLAAALGLYTVTLGGEWTEEELAEKRMVRLDLLYVMKSDVCRRWRMRRRRGGGGRQLGLMEYSM